MADRTITALYDNRAAADAAKQRLSSIGVTSVDIHDEGSASSLGSTATSAAKSTGGLLGGLKSVFGTHDDAQAYAEGLKRGHVLLTAKVGEALTDQAIEVLEGSGAVDFDHAQASWKSAGWTAPATATQDEKLQLAEERLVVGKREVERGSVRVRSYVVETPVSEQISLRQERVEMERRPVDRVVTGTEDVFQDRSIEMRETEEEAIVGKQTVITGEVGLHKEVTERTEEVRDTVRRTEVEVERLDGNVERLSEAKSSKTKPTR